MIINERLKEIAKTSYCLEEEKKEMARRLLELEENLLRMWNEPGDHYNSGDDYAQFFRNSIAKILSPAPPIEEQH